MNYAIHLLQRVIKEHQIAIMMLESSQAESFGAQVFIDDEIKERKDYIEQLQIAIKKLL